MRLWLCEWNFFTARTLSSILSSILESTTRLIPVADAGPDRRLPSVYHFVGLAIWKIWRTIYVSINGPGDPDLWPWNWYATHLRWGTFLPNLGTLGLWFLELFTMYATDGQRDRRTDKSNAYCPLPHRRGHNNWRSLTRKLAARRFIPLWPCARF